MILKSYSGTTLRLSGDILASCGIDKNVSENDKDNILKRQNSILSKNDSFDIKVSQKYILSANTIELKTCYIYHFISKYLLLYGLVQRRDGTSEW